LTFGEKIGHDDGDHVFNELFRGLAAPGVMPVTAPGRGGERVPIKLEEALPGKLPFRLGNPFPETAQERNRGAGIFVIHAPGVDQPPMIQGF
jgi:hypothetical protein